MNIFLAGIIQGSIAAEEIHPQDWRSPIKAVIDRQLPGADVYCHYTAHQNSITYDGPKIRWTFDDGVDRAKQADLVVAYLPSASMGTAIEIYEAYRSGAIVLTITPMAANWVVRLYSHKIFDTVESFEAFLAGDECKALLAGRRENQQ
ncbi:MAG: hypothetical protein K8S55_12145 [Phycisphaerae bacterium]|nr:hypothetical protein [Phycisphaerae bacterium]